MVMALFPAEGYSVARFREPDHAGVREIARRVRTCPALGSFTIGVVGSFVSGAGEARDLDLVVNSPCRTEVRRLEDALLALVLFGRDIGVYVDPCYRTVAEAEVQARFATQSAIVTWKLDAAALRGTPTAEFRRRRVGRFLVAIRGPMGGLLGSKLRPHNCVASLGRRIELAGFDDVY